MCAEFLGWELKSYPTHMATPFSGKSVWFSPTSSDGKTRTFACERGKEFFDSDWSWIMEVRNKILSINQFSSTGQRFKFNIYGCAKCKKDDQDTPFKVRIEGTLSSEKSPLIEINGFDEKEAVVQAIWEFLNWYKENKE